MSNSIVPRGLTRTVMLDQDSAWLSRFFRVSCVDALEERGGISIGTAKGSAVESGFFVDQQLSDAVQVVSGDVRQTINLRDAGQIQALLPTEDPVLIDISGLIHPVWTALVSAARARCSELWVLYAEPKSYRAHPSPASRSVFDLSTEIRGLSPLPGLATITGDEDYAESLFVPFLGFEGARAWYLAQELDSEPSVLPVVGLPGFQIDYPAMAISCNQDFLGDRRAFSAIRYARASCPFAAYEALAQIRADNPDAFLYVAPVGTKPHALGAVLFAQDHDGVEIMYDHPVRKAQRTSGVGRVHAYRI